MMKNEIIKLFQLIIIIETIIIFILIIALLVK